MANQVVVDVRYLEWVTVVTGQHLCLNLYELGFALRLLVS